MKLLSYLNISACMTDDNFSLEIGEEAFYQY